MDLNIPQSTFTPEIAQELIKLGYKTIALSVPMEKDFKPCKMPSIEGLEILLRVNCTYSTFRPGIMADIIAIQVENEQELDKVVDLAIDIITIDSKLKIKRKVAIHANKNGIVFELLYTKGYTLEGRKVFLLLII